MEDNTGITGMNKLIGMQKELMDKVPHEVRPDSLVLMVIGIDIMRALLMFLNSTGHKPWRPNPLTKERQSSLLGVLGFHVSLLENAHRSGATGDLLLAQRYLRQLVSAYGIIEEAIEHIDTILLEKPEPEQLEELTDILFFYLEQMINNSFSWQQVEEEYICKHAVNMERYRKAKEGDYSWDKRGEGGL